MAKKPNRPLDAPGQTRVFALFQPQAWIDGNAVDIDGAWYFDVTKQIFAMGPDRAKKISDYSREADELWHEYVRQNPDDDYDGPFSVIVEDEIEKYFKAQP